HRILFVRDQRAAFRAARCFPVVGIEEEKVDVGAVVQFVAAQLAQGDDAETGARGPPLRVAVLGLSVALLEFEVAVDQRIRQHYVRQRRKLQGGLAQGRKTKNILERDAQMIPLLEAREPRREPGIRTGNRDTGEVLQQAFVGLELGEVAVARKLDGKGRVSQEGLGEKSAVA